MWKIFISFYFYNNYKDFQVSHNETVGFKINSMLVAVNHT